MIINSPVFLIAPFPPPFGGMGVRFEQMALSLESKGILIKRIRLDTSKCSILRFYNFLKPAIYLFLHSGSVVHLVTGSIPNFIALTPIVLAAKISGKSIILSNGGGYWKREANSNSIRSKIVRLLLKLPNVIICCNNELATAMRSLDVDSNKVETISNALPDEKGTRGNFPVPSEFSNIRNKSEVLLLYVGALKPWYGLLETLDMIAGLRGKGIDCTLVALVKEDGDKDFLSSVRERAQALSLNENFRIFVSVPWAVTAIAQADIFIRATNTIEGDSRAVREAIAVGTPVIASDIGHRPEGTRLFKAGDAESMLDAAKSILDNSNKTVPVLNNNREGEHNLNRLISLYSELSDSR